MIVYKMPDGSLARMYIDNGENFVSVDDIIVVNCKKCWFYNAETMFCSLHESDFSPNAFCSYGTTDGRAKYWGLNKKEHDTKMEE